MADCMAACSHLQVHNNNKVLKKVYIMSKNKFKRAIKLARVVAIPGRQIKNSKGEVVKQLYNIYKVG